LTRQTNGVDILSIDAKDIYISNHYIKDKNRNSITGYNIRYKDGEINTKKFINTLDFSLDLIKLKKVYSDVYRNRKFSFTKNNHTYTARVINVTFKYSNKEFNLISKDTYIKFGYDIRDLMFEDSVCIINDELVGVIVNQNVDNPIDLEMFGEKFYFHDGKYHAKTIRTLNTVADLRNDLYHNGFYCDGVKFIRFKRSSGSARVGKCLFIDEKLYYKMHQWERCGLKVKENQSIDLAAWESYISLTLSSIIDTIEISPKNILLIDDYESVFREDVIETRYENGELKTDNQNVAISNSIFDGQSLMDISVFEKYKDKGMLLLRNRFFKSCCFNANIQQWFRDNSITEVSQLNGFTVATDIADIKLITTPSSIKYLKFGSFQQWIDNLDVSFGVVKYEKPQHNFDGRMVYTHYQLINTLQLSMDEMNNFLSPTLKYLDMLKRDPDVVRHYVKYPQELDNDITPLQSKNDIVYRLLGLNNKFAGTKYYHEFKTDLTKAFVKNLKEGRVLVNGNYSTLLGNPIEMLLHSIGRFNGDSVLGVGNIHNTRFKYDTTLLASRSPHCTIGNILLARNVADKKIDKYINLTPEIACINSINENILQRLSGCDFDSDTFLLTDNEILIKSAAKNYDLFKVPTNNVSYKKTKRFFTSSEKCDLDIKTSSNLIGDIINLSQELNTLLWHLINSGKAFNDIKEIYWDICQLDVMSGIEIDKAKKEFEVNNAKELKKIRERYLRKDEENRIIKPYFFGHIAKGKGYYNSAKKNYVKHNTAMDYLQNCVNSFQAKNMRNNKKKEFVKFGDILNCSNYDSKNVDYHQINEIFKEMEDSKKRIAEIKSKDHLGGETKYKLCSDERQGCIEYIGQIKLNYSTMVKLLLECDTKEKRHIYRTIINILFGYPNTEFYELILNSIEPIQTLQEDCNGDIKIYDFVYSKMPILTKS